MKKILFLGFNLVQIDGFEYCRSQGYEIHVCGNRPRGLGWELVDHYVNIDFFDIEAVCNYARQVSIDLVYSLGNDAVVPYVSEISERLGLPRFVSASVAVNCSNKVQLRTHLGTEFAGNLPFRAAVSPECLLEWDLFPCVLKPADSQASRGVFFISDRQALAAAYIKMRPHSRSGVAIIEPYIDGSEHSCYTYWENGALRLSSISDRIMRKDFFGNSLYSIMPTRLTSAAQVDIIRLLKDLARALGIDNGPLFAQMRMQGERAFLLEASPRWPGGPARRVIQLLTGEDWLAATFEHLLRGKLVVPLQEAAGGSYWWMLTGQPPGTIVRHALPVGINPVFARWNYLDGAVVPITGDQLVKTGYLAFADTGTPPEEIWDIIMR